MNGDLLVMLKVAERCNINCSYCYMYQGVDQGWKSRPKFLSDMHLGQVIARLEQHRAQHPSARMTLEIHGGEPLLMGKQRAAVFFGALRRRLPRKDLFIVTQSNGLLVDSEWLDLYAAHDATLAISCDGPVAAHDRHRIDFRGRGTGSQVERAIRLCLSHPSGKRVFNGVLAVIDPSNDPREMIEYFYRLGVSDVDLLLPDAHVAAPPRHIAGYSHAKLLDFLRRGFDAWIALDDPRFRVRIFETFIRGCFGRRSELDAFGGALAPIVVVESDGSYRLLDVMSLCAVDASKTPLCLAGNSFAEFVGHAERRYPKPCATCRSCEAFATCGGGYVPHRYDGRSYDNPSFYCDVLFGLYRHVRAVLAAQQLLPPQAIAAD
jgi:uncharacterized protein